MYFFHPQSVLQASDLGFYFQHIRRIYDQGHLDREITCLDLLSVGWGSLDEHKFSAVARNASYCYYQAHMNVKPRVKWLKHDIKFLHEVLDLCHINLPSWWWLFINTG